MPNQPLPVAQNQFRTLGDHPALNLLNTVRRVEGALVDSLQSDPDVLRWLRQLSLPAEYEPANLRPSLLLHSTRTLRETIRTLVERKKAGKRADVTDLNAFLAEAQSHLELVPNKSGEFHLKRRWKRHTPEQVLAPLAEATADLFAT